MKIKSINRGLNKLIKLINDIFISSIKKINKEIFITILFKTFIKKQAIKTVKGIFVYN